MTDTVNAPVLPSASVDALETSVRGEVIRPDSAGYDTHRRVWNGAIDRRPALIVRCATAADVTAAVRFGQEHDLRIAVRSGGHSFPGLSTCDDGIVIDLGLMKGIDVDPARGTVRAQAGVLLGELDRRTQPYGLSVPAGIVSHTGIAGLTLGGGMGWQQRKHGLTIDNLLAADVVTAEGDVVTASADEHAELFWGLRGGGGNFGVVTSFEFRANPVGQHVMAGPIFWPMDDAPGLLRFYREWVADCPDELTTIVVQRRLPALASVPAHLVGTRVIGVVVCCTGPIDAAEAVVRPLKAHGTPLLDLCDPTPFLVHQSMFDPSFRHGCWYYVRSCDVAELDDDVIDTVVEFGQRISSPMSSIALWQMGGAVARVADDETAFHGRQAGFTFNINGNTETAAGFDDERAWARAYWDALAPHHTSVYVNFLMDEGEQRIREAYGPVKHARLRALKRRYDPGNVFRLNQNIRPA
jgi:FAD/FMN-containing dehydrogenase